MIYVQDEDLAMEDPPSSSFSEIYPQNLENTKIAELMLKQEVEGYFR